MRDILESISLFFAGFIVGALFAMFMWAGVAGAAPKVDSVCKNNPLYCKIIKFDKHINPTYAMELSNKIYSKAKKAGINPNVALAILMHESGLHNINTFKTSISVSEVCNNQECNKITTTVEKLFDMSVAQINFNTAQAYGFDIPRLYKGDLDYALDCYMIILKDKIKMCPQLGNKAWSCYHSTTEEYRTIYVELVSRYL